MANGFDTSGSSTGAPAVQSAIVVDNKDPSQMGRVKVSFPWDGNSSQSNWARVVQPLAGDKYGYYFLPEINDQVLVAFEGNNHDNPIVIGSLYSGDGKQADCYDADNYIKNIKTKAGNEIRISDKPGSEQITITNKTANDNQIILTVEDSGKITITSNGKIELTAPDIKLSANDHLALCGGQVAISGTKISLHTDNGEVLIDGNKVSVNGTSEVDVSGAQIKVAADTQLTVDGGQSATIKAALSMTVQATGETAIKGGMVMIN